MILSINIDLFLLGVAIASTAILGFIIFLNDSRSQTGRAFLFFSVVTLLWDTTNFLDHQITSVALSFWLIRLTIFLAVWHSFALFHLFYVFPDKNVTFPRWYRFGLIPIVAFSSLLTLTPFVFKAIQEISPEGKITKISNGSGIVVFVA